MAICEKALVHMTGKADEARSQPEVYRCGPVVRWNQGCGQELLYFPLSGTARRMESPLADILEKWTSFLSVDEAVRRMCAALPGAIPDEMFSTIHELIGAGLLIGRSRLLNDTAVADSPTNISWLAIPTADRSAFAARACRSYADNIRQFGRKCEVLVSDDSHDSSHRADLLHALAELHDDSALSLWFCGVQEKASFARRLCEGGSIPPEVVQFGLFGSDTRLTTVGANRNCVLLHTAGALVLSIDDDTICQPGLVPETGSGLAVMGHQDPAEMWCFLSRDAALDFAPPSQVDVLGEHAKYLGRRLRSVLSAANNSGGLGNLDRLCGHVLTSLACDRGFIRATYNGARGDSGSHTDFGLVTHRSSMTRQRVRDLGEKYRTILDSRQVVRQALRATVSHADAGTVGMCIGLDNRTTLPPFLPECRNEDGVFAAMLAHTSDHHYVAHLPFTLAHEPAGGRAYAADRDAVVRLSDLITGFLLTWRPEPGDSNPIRRGASIGRYFVQLSALPPSEFEERAKALTYRRVSSMIRRLEDVLMEDKPMPCSWVADLRGRINALRRMTENAEFFVPVDLPVDSDDPPTRRMQRAIGRYGRLLEWWPAITERAVELRSHGITIGRCVGAL